MSYGLLLVDYALKVGDLGTANAVMDIFKNTPEFKYDDWLLGHEAWEHREQNAEAIMALYQNDDPTDDPTTASLKSHQWGPNTITCQLCHQAQGRDWPVEEQATVIRPTDEESFVDNWPLRQVSWDGAFISYVTH